MLLGPLLRILNRGSKNAPPPGGLRHKKSPGRLRLKGIQGLVLKRMGSRLTWNWAFIGDSVNFVSDVKKSVKIPLYIRKS